MNKTFLVAMREYVENLKTKAFWLGIMALPVILVLSILVPQWLEKGKDVRYYAVIDNSESRLLAAIDERSTFPDMEKVLRAAVDWHAEESAKFDELPEILRRTVIKLKQMIDEHTQSGTAEAAGEAIDKDEFTDEVIKQGALEIAKAVGPEGLAGTAAAGLVSEEILEKVQGVFDEQVKKPIKDWYDNLSPEEAESFRSSLSKSRYARIAIKDDGQDPEEAARKMLNDDELFAFFVIGPDPEKDSEGCKYVSNNQTDDSLLNWFKRLANEEVRFRRIQSSAIDKQTADWIQAPLRFSSKQVSEAGEEEIVEKGDVVRQWAPVVFVYLLWISIFTITQMLLTNTIEEKSNKIMEVLLSSVSPLQLMAGKIIGIACTGLTMVVSWVIFFLACLKCMPLFLDHMPDLDLSLIARDPVFLASFLGYFILGYLLLSAILVGIGSVCNSLKEAQNLMAPVTIILIVPLLAMVPIGQDPNGTIAKFLSYIPPFTPFVMMNRAAGPPTTMEYVVTTILLVISIVVALWAAAKVFRIGVLLTGKPPKMREIFKWLRAPVGHVQVRRDE